MDNNPYFDLYIDEGTTFELVIGISDVAYDELTGKEMTSPSNLSDITSISAKVKKDFTNSSPTLLTFSCSVFGEPENGEILLSLTSSDTTGIASGSAPFYHLGYYDIILVKSTGAVIKLVSGKVFVNQTITI